MSDAPKDRDALIEVMARAFAGPGAFHWTYEPTPGDAECFIETQRSIDRQAAETVLTALESSGCFVGPVVATDEMCEAAWNAPLPRQDADNKRERNRYRCEPIWTAMQSANPYRKDPSQ